MNNFTNVNIKKEYKKKIINLIIGVVLIILALGCKVWQNKEIEKAIANTKDLNSIIVKKEGKKEGLPSYLNVKSKPFKFAVYDDTTNSYYIVSDGKYLYVLYMTLSDFRKLNVDTITEKAIKVEGVTAPTTIDIKKLAIEVYNEGLEDAEKLTLADYDNYFGSVYLDLTRDIGTNVAPIPWTLFFFLTIIGVIVLIVALAELISFKKAIKKLADHEIEDLDKELNKDSAFYYQKAHLYLTDHFIVNFGGFLRIIRYEDILWMYKFEQRTNGIKTSQNLKVLTKDGKTSSIANIDVVTKAKREVFDEIANTIASKNNKILIGYTEENIKAMKEKVKEIKRNRV